MEVAFEKLQDADLIVDTIYKGGPGVGKAAEVLSKLLPNCSNSGGFRPVKRQDSSELPAFVVLYTSMQELAWPDYFDEETGILRYYGDNRKPGRTILDTPKKGNQLLEYVFECLNSKGESIKNIPPFFVFKKTGSGCDVQFLGMAAPGNQHISPDKDLVSFWRIIDGQRFQNYEAYFTILETTDPISKKWINSLIYDHENSMQNAPDVWKKFIKQGRNGILPLKAKKIPKVPDTKEQLPSDPEGILCLDIIRNHYKNNSYGFEACAVDLLQKMDDRFQDFTLTRPWRDGGRDALGYYVIDSGGKTNYQLRIDCALEAKCYSTNESVGVKQMSRLISRMRYRQFGVMLTTSAVGRQAYKEVIEDRHPILIVTGCDIANILNNNFITSDNIMEWLNALDESDKERLDQRVDAYKQAIKNIPQN